MKKNVKQILCLLLTLCLMLPVLILSASASELETIAAKVNDETSLYAGPSEVYDEIAVLKKGTSVELLEGGDSSWYKIRINGQVGYCTRDSLIIPVSSVQLSQKQLSIQKGESYQLTAAVSPSSATNKEVIWYSSSPSILSVDQAGKVVGLAPGTGVIFAMAEDGSKMLGSCIVNVKDDTIGNLELSVPSLRLEKGKSYTITATADGEAVDSGKLEWTSSDPSVLEVSNGVVKAVGKGQATVTAKDKNGTASATCIVTVYVMTTNIILSDSSVTLISGNTKQLTATCQPSDASETGVTWKSNNPEVASVSSTGKITANSPGTATITAASVDGASKATCTVTVTATIKMHSNNITIRKGQTYYNKTTANVASKKLTWTSDNPSIAKASTNGFIDAVGMGTTTVYASYGGEKVSCKVTVTEEEPVLRAYTSPNVAQPNQKVNFVVITPPSQTSVQIAQVTSSGEKNLSVTSSYVDKTLNGRTVRVWTMTYSAGFPMPSGESYYVYNLKAYAGNNKSEGKTFTACIVNSDPKSSTPVVTKRRATDEAIAFRMEYEGYMATVYYDSANLPTIGYGNLIEAGESFYNNMTQEEAKAEMITLINGVYTSELNTFTTRYGIKLTQYQFDALLNFTYNYGQSRWRCYDFYLRRLLLEYKNGNDIDPIELKHAFGQCSYSNGFLVGLFRGRIDEWQMFTKADYEVHPYKNNSESMVGDFTLPTAEERQPGGIYAPDMKWIGYQY